MKNRENTTSIIRNTEDDLHYVLIGVARDIEKDEDRAESSYVVRSVRGGDLLLISACDVFNPETDADYRRSAYDYEFVS